MAIIAPNKYSNGKQKTQAENCFSFQTNILFHAGLLIADGPFAPLPCKWAIYYNNNLFKCPSHPCSFCGCKATLYLMEEGHINLLNNIDLFFLYLF